jgi:deazaflavin-dependent oxidoreductase (nitroreductase family)
MPIPTVVTRFNRRVANPVIRQFAGKIAPLAIVEHRGRKSGKPYRTPVMAFPDGDEMTIALTYGAEVDWVKNVLAEGACTVDYRSRTYRLADPKPVHGSAPEAIPRLIRSILRLLRVGDFLQFRIVDEPQAIS